MTTPHTPWTPPAVAGSTRRRILVFTAAALLVVVTAGVTAALAGNNDPAPAPAIQTVITSQAVDQQFIDAVHARGIEPDQGQGLVDLAHQVCDSLDSGASFSQVQAAIAAAGYTASDAGFLAGVSAGTYCPQHHP